MPNWRNLEIQACSTGRFAVEASVRDHTLRMDQPAPYGGNSGPTPLETLLAAAASCFVSTAKVIAYQRGMAIGSLCVTVSGCFDVDISSGRAANGRPGLNNVQFLVRMECTAPIEEQQALLAEVQRRAPVLDNLFAPTPIQFELEMVPA